MTEATGVRERLQREYQLKVLRIWLDSSDGRGQVMFSFSSTAGEEEALLTASADEIGLPFDPDTAWSDDGRGFKIPDHIVGALRHLLANTEPPNTPLWIRLSPPLGLLPIVPWEHLLQPVVAVPILRLPFHMICPKAPDQELDAVICLSSPVAKRELQKDLVKEFMDQIPVDLARQTNFHLFADFAVYEDLLRIKALYGDDFRIHVYDPREAASRRGAGMNPWLSWIREALRGRSADVVHFISHCYRLRADGALALAESPTRNDKFECATIVSAADLAEFLNESGAWSVAFTSPRTNHSPAGMRLLQDSVARSRPGPVLLHDMAHSDSKRALATAYWFLYGQGQPPPASPAVSLYCHPYRYKKAMVDAQSEWLLHEFTLAGKLGDRLTKADQPSWLAASQRALEASSGNLAEAIEANPDSGRKRARDFVLEALAEYAANPEAANESEES